MNMCGSDENSTHIEKREKSQWAPLTFASERTISMAEKKRNMQ